MNKFIVTEEEVEEFSPESNAQQSNPNKSAAISSSSVQSVPITPGITGIQKFPVTTKQVACKIDGIHTEIVLSAYSDYIMIVITQNNKLGTLVRNESSTSIVCAAVEMLLSNLRILILIIVSFFF